jgi:DNA-binding XRE family transcriptional regulator
MTPEIIQKEGHPYAVVPIEMYKKLVEDSEMLADIQAYDNAIVRNEEFFPLDVIEKITIDGEHPLKVWREYRNLTQEQLAEAVENISPSYLSEIESGKQTGSIEVISAIADVLNVDVEMIL